MNSLFTLRRRLQQFNTFRKITLNTMLTLSHRMLFKYKQLWQNEVIVIFDKLIAFIPRMVCFSKRYRAFSSTFIL